MGKVTTTSLITKKQAQQKITVLTCYDYLTAKLMNEAGIDILLVGDTLAMVVLGYETTLPVTMEEMLHHVKAVKRGNTNSLLVADMPYLSYQIKPSEAVRNAGRFLKEGGAEAVKIEGGREMLKTVRAMLDADIPVMGHIGLTPQAVHKMGGYKVQGREKEQAERLKEDALLLQEAGVFSIVLEGLPWQLAKEITESLDIPTISCGAGQYCDGQVLVTPDMLGLFPDFKPKFVKKYADVGKIMLKAFKQYKREVESGKFPDKKHSY
ncbi:MAG: 3-methyl-2-oxobutanoate hydroxymethyltransferase [bacterium]|nr:3-methyl-2-oxobutanoate hydroxymethyltransferase [bacterium]MDD5354536.1 3-methyl-2-oxobutanoate hydroxymethyltransferase [bacterium]MDD5756767.1 3-methyl-2-oxobutanoate hydroxymethyltransferase [bacterium]